MTVELVTGRAGKAHIDSADIGAFNAYTLGTGVYVLNGCTAAVVSSNQVTVSAGELLINGRHVRITGSGEDMTIENGTSGYNRRDIIAAHYVKDDDDIETVELVVVKGTATTSTAADPEMPVTGDILEGASENYTPLFRVTLSGLTVSVARIVSTLTVQAKKMNASPANIEFATSSTANNGGYIDFHYNASTADYTARIIEDASGKINILPGLKISGTAVSDWIQAASITGTIGTWDWIKFKNQWAICWLTRNDQTVGGGSASSPGGVLYSSNLPFSFVDGASTIVSAAAVSGHAKCFAGYTSTTTTTADVYVYNTESSGGKAYADFVVFGRYA